MAPENFRNSHAMQQTKNHKKCYAVHIFNNTSSQGTGIIFRHGGFSGTQGWTLEVMDSVNISTLGFPMEASVESPQFSHLRIHKVNFMLFPSGSPAYSELRWGLFGLEKIHSLRIFNGGRFEIFRPTPKWRSAVFHLRSRLRRNPCAPCQH